jgi:hypothetical protein
MFRQNVLAISSTILTEWGMEFYGKFPRLIMVTKLLNKVGFKADYEDDADEIPPPA